MAKDQPTTFELRVDFSGVSLYVLHPDLRRVGFVMPEARYQGNKARHLDDTPAEAHAGYVRFDLANLVAVEGAVPTRDPAETPSYEVVHQVERETVEFQLPPAAERITVDLALPRFDEFAPVLTTRPALFEAAPPPEVLMRTVMDGGTLTSVAESAVEWELAGDLHPEGRTFVYRLGGAVRWRRTVNAPGMTLRFVRFGRDRITEFALRPTTAPGDRPAISLKIGNLCTNNPLEWRTLPPVDTVIADTDFKWLYRLLQLRDEHSDVRYPPRELPHPRPRPTANMNVVYDCFGGMISAEF